MNVITRSTILSLIFVSALLTAEATLTGVTLGSHVSGPKITAADTKNRVVLFEYWGVNCPPCLRSIPHLSHWQEEHGENLLVIANHCQNASDTDTAAKWIEKGGNDLVTVINHGSLPGANVSGIPHCFLFNHEGTLIYDGNPFEVEAKIAAAVAASPGALIAGRTYTKHVQLAKVLGKTKVWGGALKKLRKAAADGTDEEAQFLLDRVTAWAEKEMSEIELLTSEDPFVAMSRLSDTVARLKKDILAERFEDMQKVLKKDKAFKKILKGCQIVAAIKADAAKKQVNLKMAKQSKKIAGYAKNYVIQLLKVEDKYQGTAAAQQAAVLRASFEKMY